MGIESYHIPAGLQPDCRTLPGLQWESGSPPDSGGNTRGRVKYSGGSSKMIGYLWGFLCMCAPLANVNVSSEIEVLVFPPNRPGESCLLSEN